jgi:hypothetical protein
MVVGDDVAAVDGDGLEFGHDTELQEH